MCRFANKKKKKRATVLYAPGPWCATVRARHHRRVSLTEAPRPGSSGLAWLVAVQKRCRVEEDRRAQKKSSPPAGICGPPGVRPNKTRVNMSTAPAAINSPTSPGMLEND